MYAPYTYLIKWSATGKYYYGAQYGKAANPKNLWSTYFTSSKYVKKYRKDFGEPDIIQIRRTFKSKSDCLLWEHRILKKIIHDKNCLNISSNIGTHAICIAGFVTVKNDNGETSLVSVNDSRYLSGELKHIATGTTSVYDPISMTTFRVSVTDPRFLSGELISTNKGKSTPNQSGRKWINDGINNKYLYPHELAPFLDSGFVFGQIQSKSTRDYSKSANSQLGSCWIFHELIGSKKIKYESFPQYYDQGWFIGRKKHWHPVLESNK